MHIDEVHTTVYLDEGEMGNTAMSAIRLIGEVVDKLCISSPGLTPKDRISVKMLSSLVDALTTWKRHTVRATESSVSVVCRKSHPPT